MNTTPDSTPQPPQPAGGFFAWIRGLGIVRGSDRWFAGVAGGIATKAKIDPLIVRGIFVVLALLGGPGILLYLVGWLLLPDFTGRIRLEDLFRGRVEGWTIVALVVVALSVIPTMLGLFTPGAFGWSMAPWGFFGFPSWLSATITWLIWIAIIVFAAIWISRAVRSRGAEQLAREQAARQHAGQAGPAAANDGSGSAPSSPAESNGDAGGSGSDTTDAPQWTADATQGRSTWTAGTAENPSAERSTTWTADSNGQPGNWGDDFGRKADAWGRDFGKKAEAWGEDVGKRADEWSARYTEHHEARKLGAAHVLITFALALLAGGGAAIWANSLGVSQATTAVAALVAALAVFAGSLIVAGIRGRNTGWVGFLSACGVVTLLFTAILPWGTQFQPFGTLKSEGTNAPGAVLLAGSTGLDLSKLDATTSGKQDDFVIWQLFGNSTVTLPDDYPVVVDVRVLGGNINESGNTKSNAAGPFLAKTISNTAENSPSVTHVTVYLVFGNVTVVVPDEMQKKARQSEESARLQAEAEVKRLEQKRLELESLETKAPAEKLKHLETKLEKVEWQLEEPGLSKSEQSALEAERTQLKQDIKDLEAEPAR